MTSRLNRRDLVKTAVGILATGYRGFVAQEFLPTWPDKIESLCHAAKVCDV